MENYFNYQMLVDLVHWQKSFKYDDSLSKMSMINSLCNLIAQCYIYLFLREVHWIFSKGSGHQEYRCECHHVERGQDPLRFPCHHDQRTDEAELEMHQ